MLGGFYDENGNYISPPGLIEKDGDLFLIQDDFADYYDELAGSDEEDSDEEEELKEDGEEELKEDGEEELKEDEKKDNQIDLKLQNGKEISLNDENEELEITRNEHCLSGLEYLKN